MTQKQIKYIFISAGLLGLGITLFSIRRKKNFLYAKISKDIESTGGLYNPDAGDTGGYGGDAGGCKMSSAEIKRASDNLHWAQFGEWYTLGFGTQEGKIISEIQNIRCAPCFNAVSNLYAKERGGNLKTDLRSEFSGTELRTFESELAKLKSIC